VESFIKAIPKAELHLHIEGTLEPKLMFQLAKRNNIVLPFSSEAEIRKAYNFKDLQSFLDIYYQGAQVLLTEQDFYDLTWAYFLRVKKDNVCHVEMFFDPQTHTQRGVAFKTVITGIRRAQEDAKQQLAITSELILCFLRHLSEEDGFATLQSALPFKEWIIAVGLDSAEKGNPPEKFTRLFEKSRQEGFFTVAHAGEEGPSEYIHQALTLLGARRIDHGVRCLEDETLTAYLKKEQIPLTVCPLSNIKLRVFNTMRDHNLKILLDKGLCVTINSDDPAYFGGYVVDNFLAAHEVFHFSKKEIQQLAKNSFEASFLPRNVKEKYKTLIKQFD